jgi:UDPglucose 6-dehydrogenase
MKHKLFYISEYAYKTYGKGKGMAADLKYRIVCQTNCQSCQKTIKLLLKKSTLSSYRRTIKSILDHTGNGVQFQILSNPEFLAEGTAVQDLLHPIMWYFSGGILQKRGQKPYKL